MVESVGCAAGAYLPEHTFVRTLVAVVEEAAQAALHAVLEGNGHEPRVPEVERSVRRPRLESVHVFRVLRMHG